MKSAAHVVLMSVMSLLVHAAGATEPPPRPGAEPAPAAGKDAPQTKVEQQLQKQLQKQPQTKPQTQPRPVTRRRSVQMTVDSMPGPAVTTPYGTVAPPPAVYGPTLTSPSAPRTASTPLPPIVNTPPAPGPVIMNSCDAGGCTGTNGVRYNGGVGNVLIGPQGRPCNRVGASAQC